MSRARASVPPQAGAWSIRAEVDGAWSIQLIINRENRVHVHTFFLRKGRVLLIKLERLHLEQHNAQRKQENDRARRHCGSDAQRAGPGHELKHLTLSLSAGTLPWVAFVPPLAPRI